MAIVVFAGMVISAVTVVPPDASDPSTQTSTSEKPSAATAANVVSVVPVGQPAVGTRSIVAEAGGGGGGGGGGGLTGVSDAPGDEMVVSEHAASVSTAILAIVASFKVFPSFILYPFVAPSLKDAGLSKNSLDGANGDSISLCIRAGLSQRPATVSVQFRKVFMTDAVTFRNAWAQP